MQIDKDINEMSFNDWDKRFSLSTPEELIAIDESLCHVSGQIELVHPQHNRTDYTSERLLYIDDLRKRLMSIGNRRFSPE